MIVHDPAGPTAEVAFAASLFTHLLEPGAQHYLAESARCLRRGGILVASIHTEPRAVEKFSGREDRIDIDAVIDPVEFVPKTCRQRPRRTRGVFS